jgi:hypothetical protein
MSGFAMPEREGPRPKTGDDVPHVSDEAVSELVEKNWGEPHPMKNQGVNEVLCYAPRTREEIEIVKLALIESYRYASGRESGI